MALKAVAWLVLEILRLALEVLKIFLVWFGLVARLFLVFARVKAFGLKLDCDEVYEDYQRIYDKTLEMQNDKKNERGRGRAR